MTVNTLQHTLWTKAVSNQDYNKKEWQELDLRLYDLHLILLDIHRLAIEPLVKEKALKALLELGKQT